MPLQPIETWTPSHTRGAKVSINYVLPPARVYETPSGELTTFATHEDIVDGETVQVANTPAMRVMADGTEIPRYNYGTVDIAIEVVGSDGTVKRAQATQDDLTNDEIMGLAAVGGSAMPRIAGQLGIAMPD